ncbi:MAG TPA: helix-turn-helix domain-containing protein [Clostridiaceae bacterium]
MKIDTSEKWLPVFEALDSIVRLKIVGFLSVKPMNIKELAHACDLSSAIMTMHIKKLEKAGIIKTTMKRSTGGIQKLCTLILDRLEVEFPHRAIENKFVEISIPIGHYTDFEINPTCGIATAVKLIGHFDDPRYFADTERVNAAILWFAKGFVEYRIPNYILSCQRITKVEITMEIASEAPGANENYPSDISFWFSEKYIGKWTSPGDYADKRGRFTPDWWFKDINQYGLLKILSIEATGTYMDSQLISDINISQIKSDSKYWTFKIGVLDSSEHIGGG